MRSIHVGRRATGGLCCAMVLCLAAPGLADVGCIPQDLDGNGKVDGGDLGILLGAWGASGGFGPSDFNEDGQVDGGDLGAMLATWGDVPPSACVTIKGIFPESGAPGDVLQILGHFPHNDPDDYCAVAMAESGQVVPFEVISVEPDSLKVRVGPYPPGTPPAAVMVGVGDGDSGDPDVPGVIFGAGTWSWAGYGPGAMSDVLFHPLSAGAPVSGTYYGTLVAGQLCVTISGDCPAGTSFSIWPRAHHYGNGTPNDPYVGYDCFIPCVEIASDADEMTCAQAICAAVVAAYASHTPPIAVTCTVTAVTGGHKLTLSLVGLAIDWGMFNIQVLSPNACAPPAPCNPNCPCDVNGDGVVDQQDQFAIELAIGQGCGDPANPCCADLDGDGAVTIADFQLWTALCGAQQGPCQPAGCNPDCPCDINGDGVVNAQDRDAIMAAFGACMPGVACCADLNGDGQVDGADVQAWQAACAQQGGPC